MCWPSGRRSRAGEPGREPTPAAATGHQVDLMFPSNVPERFSREMGLTEADWHRSLPGAVSHHRLVQPATGQAQVLLAEGGELSLRWSELPPRQIALARLPRLQVDFQFVQTTADVRTAFMRRFDLFMQRGGG